MRKVGSLLTGYSRTVCAWISRINSIDAKHLQIIENGIVIEIKPIQSNSIVASLILITNSSLWWTHLKHWLCFRHFALLVKHTRTKTLKNQWNFRCFIGHYILWEGVGTSKIRTSKGQNVKSIFRMIRTSKIRTSKRMSKV
jgi:hypothetical protein